MEHGFLSLGVGGFLSSTVLFCPSLLLQESEDMKIRQSGFGFTLQTLLSCFETVVVFFRILWIELPTLPSSSNRFLFVLGKIINMVSLAVAVDVIHASSKREGLLRNYSLYKYRLLVKALPPPQNFFC